MGVRQCAHKLYLQGRTPCDGIWEVEKPLQIRQVKLRDVELHVLQALAPHPASLAAKLEAFAILTTTTALFVQNELGGGSARQQRNAAYLNHALATGRYPQLAELLAPAAPAQVSPAEAAAEPADRYRDILARILSGLLTAS